MPCLIMAACSLVMGIGYALCPETMQGGNVLTKANRIGVLLVRSGGALYDNIGMVFASFAASAFLEDSKEPMFAGLSCYLMITALLSPAALSALVPRLVENELIREAFQFLPGPAAGILSGISAMTAMRFGKKKSREDLPYWAKILLCIPVCLIAAALLGLVWPLLYGLVRNLSASFFQKSAAYAAVYVFLNRLLTPFGLNHALNSPVLSDVSFIGDLSRYWANETGSTVGMFMAGFFAPIMFGIPGALLAVYQREERKKTAKPLLLLFALAAFVGGVSEPFEFLLLVYAPGLFVLCCLLFGVFGFLSAVSGFRAGFAFSGGMCDLIFSSAMKAAHKTWMILPLGLAAFVIFFAVFRMVLRQKRGDGDETE